MLLGRCRLPACRPAASQVSLEYMLMGIKFSWPIYTSGFTVMISSAVEQGGTWAFAEAFHWSVWVVLGVTAIVVSFVVTAVETLTFGNRANRKGLRGWSWYSMCKMVQVPTYVGDPRTWASKVLILGYAFLALIMVSTLLGCAVWLRGIVSMWVPLCWLCARSSSRCLLGTAAACDADHILQHLR
eukprot:GHRQ01032318.1.p1 GENE.GHRQ01032318.1~~GHRQ01032318.1.p1  ORF type:complete len:185 (+),score=22.72 GHRQ01032318.1:151-705(+)